MKKIYIILILIFTFLSSANSKQTYDQYVKEFSQYQSSFNKDLASYEEVQKEAFKEYKKEISKIWTNVQTPTKHKFVQYGKGYKSRKIINYENQEIIFETIAKNEKDALTQLKNMFEQTLKANIQTAIKNSKLEQKIYTKNKSFKVPNLKDKLIGDVLSRSQVDKMRKMFFKTAIVKEKQNNRYTYKIKIKLPADYMIKKAKFYMPYVAKNSKKQNIPKSLILAIIHSESSFNPMARSHIPAYGLMQIVPKSAGIDTYKYLYNKKRMLSSSYLYSGKNNITIGSGYLHILYFKYLKGIENSQSRIYCTIAAYNTGAGNVARAFIKSSNISKASNIINKLSPEQVYATLMKDLPYLETKKYLTKVTQRMLYYHNL